MKWVVVFDGQCFFAKEIEMTPERGDMDENAAKEQAAVLNQSREFLGLITRMVIDQGVEFNIGPGKGPDHGMFVISAIRKKVGTMPEVYTDLAKGIKSIVLSLVRRELGF